MYTYLADRSIIPEGGHDDYKCYIINSDRTYVPADDKRESAVIINAKARTEYYTTGFGKKNHCYYEGPRGSMSIVVEDNYSWEFVRIDETYLTKGHAICENKYDKADKGAFALDINFTPEVFKGYFIADNDNFLYTLTVNNTLIDDNATSLLNIVRNTASIKESSSSQGKTINHFKHNDKINKKMLKTTP
jgi:hypothetical protein